MKRISIILLMIFFTWLYGYAQNDADRILGKWISSEGNLIVEVFKESNYFKAKLVWFNDSDNKNKPMNERLDENNKNKSLRSRKVIGMEILQNLVYDRKQNRWEDGMIYDSQSGKEWNSSIWLENTNLLKVRGFWHFEFIGKTMSFKPFKKN